MFVDIKLEQRIISKYIKDDQLNNKQFWEMITNEETFREPIFRDKHQKVCQKMNHPMAQYYISSSHNTYLTGNQMTSQSSKEMYKKVLEDGCRCIESKYPFVFVFYDKCKMLLNGLVDVWAPNMFKQILSKAMRKGQQAIEVTHGWTLTSSLPLPKVLKIIKESAFTKSEYPVILSIENHLNLKDQKIMANEMERLLENLLDTEARKEKKMFSPEQKKRKIFVKAKISEIIDEEDGKVTTTAKDFATTMKVSEKKPEQPETGAFCKDSVYKEDEAHEAQEIPETSWFQIVKQCLPTKKKVC